MSKGAIDFSFFSRREQLAHKKTALQQSNSIQAYV
jgi:hypothetical protein